MVAQKAQAVRATAAASTLCNIVTPDFLIRKCKVIDARDALGKSSSARMPNCTDLWLPYLKAANKLA